MLGAIDFFVGAAMFMPALTFFFCHDTLADHMI
jgi:hypothetical protein